MFIYSSVPTPSGKSSHPLPRFGWINWDWKTENGSMQMGWRSRFALPALQTKARDSRSYHQFRQVLADWMLLQPLSSQEKAAFRNDSLANIQTFQHGIDADALRRGFGNDGRRSFGNAKRTERDVYIHPNLQYLSRIP